MEIKSHNLVNVSNEDIKRYIKNDLNIDITNLEKITSGWANQVYKASLNEQVVFIRINKDQEIFPVEMLGYKIFKEKGIPVPDVLFYENSPEMIKYPTMILTSAHGDPLNKEKNGMSSELRLSIYESIGKLVSNIHTVKISGWGKLYARNGRLFGIFNSWKEYRDSKYNLSYKERFQYLREKNLLDKEQISFLEKCNIELSQLEISEPSLIHLDVHHAHIFIQNNNISGLIDLGRLTAGDQRYDIAMSLMFQEADEQDAFKKGYGKLAFDTVVLKYLLFISANKLAWRDQRGLIEATEFARNMFNRTYTQLKNITE